MSAIVIPANTEPLPFTYNLKRGGQRWRDSLGRVRDTGSSSAFGCDVVVIGDSTGVYSNIFDSWPHYLKVMLQERFNRSGVTGGFGFWPFEQSSGETNGWNFVNDTDTWGLTHNIVADSATALFRASFDNGSGARRGKIWRYFDPTSAYGTFQRQGISDWQYVGLGYSGTWDTIYADQAAANSAITPVVRKITLAGGTGEWGYHWPKDGTSQTGLNAASARTIQISSADNKVAANGVILFNGDYNEGVRLHNLCSPSSTIYTWLANGDATYQDLHLHANVDQFSTGANGGAHTAKLFIINSMLNDCGTGASATITAANYKTYLQTYITRIVGRPTLPCVGLVVNQPWNAALVNAAAIARYDTYRQVCYQLAAENPDTVFVIDFWKVLTDSTHTQYAPHGANSAGGAIYDRQWYNDGTHLYIVGNQARARMVFSVLSWGV